MVNFESEIWEAAHQQGETVLEVSAGARSAVLKWFFGYAGGTSDGQFAQALEVLRWVTHAGALDYLPREMRDGRIRAASDRFGLSRGQLVELIVSSGQLMSPPASVRPQPFFIALEGVDSSGKTTQAQLLERSLDELGHSVRTVAFPRYEHYFGGELRTLLGGDAARSAETVDPRSMALWYAADRFEFFKTADLDSDFVIVNRFSLSSAVYQSARAELLGENDLFDWVMELEHAHFGLPEPHLTFVLDVPVEVSLERSKSRGAVDDDRSPAPDVYEQSQLLQERARTLYRDAAQRVKDVAIVSCVGSDGDPLPPEHISAGILDLVMSWKR